MPLQILVLIHTFPDGNSGNFAFHVSSIARCLKADVHALVLNADFPRISRLLGDMLIDVPALIDGAKAKSRERGDVLLQALQMELALFNIPLRTTHTEYLPGAASEFVSDLGRYHDLVVVGVGALDAASQATAEAVIFASGKPTLLVPDVAPAESIRHVMIAWDGSRVASRAVSDAHVFLQRVQAVTIVSVTDEKTLPDEHPGSRLAEYLARHGINASVTRTQSLGQPIAETLQRHALEIGADLLVMGGFAHSRMRDLVLGGATTGILRNLQLPVLLSH